MHILGIVGSMRKRRSTDTLVNHIINDVQHIAPNVTADIVHIADKDVHPCRVVCSEYCSTHPYQCSIADDVPVVLEQMINADALVIGAPMYFRGPPAKFQAFTERLISMFFYQESQGSSDAISPLASKPCGLIGVAEYANPHQILEYLHDFCTVLKMRPVLLDTFPYLGVAGQGNIQEDTTFSPFDRAKDLATALLNATQR